MTNDTLEPAVPASDPMAAGEPRPRARGRLRRWLTRLLLLGLGGGLLGILGAVGLFLYHGRDLPSFEKLSDYRPPQVTRVYDRNGEPVAEYFLERRTVVSSEQLPEILKQAVVAAEDSSFYVHDGLDYLGIARAVFMDLRQMRLAQGASTITQQVVKNLVLSPERSIARKVKEAILARRVEQNLSKEDILALYLNHIYFGHSRYGVEEASRFFFGKPVGELTLGEAALLAGLPQSPNRLSPLRHRDRAKARQTYVLNQMVENKFITRAQADVEIARPIALVPHGIEPVGPYYIEEVRRRLVESYGEDRIFYDGLRVELGMDRRKQQLADAALQAGLESLEQRHGYRASQITVSPTVLAGVAEGWALSAEAPDKAPDRIWDMAAVDAGSVESSEQILDALEERPLEPGGVVVAPVALVRDSEAVVNLGSIKGVIPFERMKWARPYAPGKWTAPPKRAGDVLAAGQLVRVRVLALPRAEAAARTGKAAGAPPSRVVQLELAQAAQVQGALVVIDPRSREVVAMSGGYDFARSSFNRATQARRQPGSAFKPLVYAAALASGKFTTASLLADAPAIYRDPWTGKEWRPQNYERDVYEGEMSLRVALSKSKNTISVRLVEAVGPPAVIDFARRAGIASPLPENLTIALGTAEVTPLELTNAYATLAALGRFAEPILVRRVSDASGRIHEEHHAVGEETVPPAVAFITTSLMQSVVEMGTGARARELGRPVAAKTGTASGNRDAWFAGFTSELVASAWVGFDDHSPLGGSETGGRAAMPIWMQFMQGALEGEPPRDFPRPPGVEEVLIDPASGLLAAEGSVGRTEYFVEGTAPTTYAVPVGEASPDLLFLEDGGKAWR